MVKFSSSEEQIIGYTVAGLTSTILGHPLDTIKTHLQTNRRFRNSFHVAKELRYGIFRGMAPPLVNAVVMNTVMFSVFHRVNELVGNPFVAGMFSGFATAMISTPTDYVKIHAQITGRQSWLILKATSPALLYKGHVANLGREGLFTLVYLGLYHHLVSYQREESGLILVAATSSMTGALAWVISYPFDTIKTLIQSGGSMETVASLWRNHGLSAFYKGCGASTGRAMLVTSSRMLAYEGVLQIMRQ